MFKELAPYVITATVIICALIAIKINKEDILTTDSIFAVAGFMLGLFITSLIEPDIQQQLPRWVMGEA